VIKYLEYAGIKVISLTGDKASENCKFIRMHQFSGDPKTTVHTVLNKYSVEEWYIFFFSDVPHLIKTNGKCWSNSFSHSCTRPLWINGKHISWEHLRRIYNRRSSAGLSLIPKITLEHINLHSYSRMRVNLAAKVLSKSVADALYTMLIVTQLKLRDLFDKWTDFLIY
jgi:hypothetical protein